MVEARVISVVVTRLPCLSQWFLVLLAVLLSWLVGPQARAGNWSCADDAPTPDYAVEQAPPMVEVYLASCRPNGPPGNTATATTGSENFVSEQACQRWHNIFMPLCIFGLSKGCTYDAFGILIASTGTTFNRFLYCGEEWDANLGMYNQRARWMEPGRGRFWSMDTYGGNNEDPGSLHKNLYCYGNPINCIDPSGHDLCELMAIINIMSIDINLASAGIQFANGNTTLGFISLLGAASGIFGLFADMLPPALMFATAAGVSAVTATEVATGMAAIIASTDLAYAMSGNSQDHHIMTDKNYTSSAPNGEGPYTPKFIKLLKGTGLNLQSEENIISVLNHKAKAPQANKVVYDALIAAIKGLKQGSPEYTQAIIGKLKDLAKESITPGTLLNQLLTKQ